LQHVLLSVWLSLQVSIDILAQERCLERFGLWETVSFLIATMPDGYREMNEQIEKEDRLDNAKDRAMAWETMEKFLVQYPSDVKLTLSSFLCKSTWCAEHWFLTENPPPPSQWWRLPLL
jgi:hypothetical protein